MQWLKRYWPESLLALTLLVIETATRYSYSSTSANATATHQVPTNLNISKGWTIARKRKAREKTRELWYHGYDSYMKYAFPRDELNPLTCQGQGPDWLHPANIARNDVAGNFSLTLIDVIDTFIVLQDVEGFAKAVRNIIDVVRFDSPVKPQVFEITIRVLGGLLSGHIFASSASTPSSPNPFYLPWYKGEMLDLAKDLGERLLPAFETPTGIPIARINLLTGLSLNESVETCTAGAGSLIIEFGTLSRLTSDPRFERAAYKAFFAIWNRRSEKNLVGNTINAWSGKWLHPQIAGIGAGVDSFYEYALKWYVMSGDPAFLDVWLDAYASIMRYARAGDGYYFRSVNMNTGDIAFSMVDSLSAFFPGLQVLAGDVENAIKSHLMYWNLWRRHSGIPEVWDINHRTATSFQYPLRPEFIESTWYLYRATRDTFYLDIGERILTDITYRSKVKCGLAGIEDLRTNLKDDRMESFALSETLKYLYLLFDENNSLHSDDSNFVLTTEGHILRLPSSTLVPLSPARRLMRGNEQHTCPAPMPVFGAYDWTTNTGLVQSVRGRVDADLARYLGGMAPQPADEYLHTPDGWCVAPKVELFSYDFVLSQDGKTVAEDLKPGANKIEPHEDGYIIHNVSGIRAHIVSRLDGKGYDVTKLGPYSVHFGQLVYINDTSLRLTPAVDNVVADEEAYHRPHSMSVKLRFKFLPPDATLNDRPFDPPFIPADIVVPAYTAFFGGDLSAPPVADKIPLRMAHPSGTRLMHDPTNSFGCNPYTRFFKNDVVIVTRGNCTFLEKLGYARDAGASGVLVASNVDTLINPSSTPAELLIAGDLSDAVCLVLTATHATSVAEMMLIAAKRSTHVIVTLEHPKAPIPAWHTLTGGEELVEEEPRVLYLNGHALLNTRLLI